METDLWQFEHWATGLGYTRIAGVDEAGRGPLAGPVVAAAVVLPTGFSVGGVTDSKALTPRRRSLLFDRIYHHAAAIGIGIVDPVEIHRINILQAARLAMGMAVENLHPQPDCLLIDGTYPIDWAGHQQAIAKGDARSVSIGAASIVAKVSRDRLMQRYDTVYPQYGFARHKGYPTQAHRQAIQIHGCCPIHRRGFKGVREYLSLGGDAGQQR